MKETYFVIRNSDGDTTVTEVTKEQLLKNINDGEYQDAMYKLPTNSDTNYWDEHSCLIIKGKIVTPSAVEVVTKYDIE